ncbi:putative mannosyl-oligosaccharide alpha-1,2-mannosidase [Neolecta irregularis DAH-3]|uniref:alpha-1,2-Mannosidase n=1 Tax=Neolecta irregularis (strain DAH-3) TaxID=1198029 RepID=A0A1U7LM67_NEOID|nr:putative mannosyl-oligosaccharide alpha-1,2-mannosidase [Neolecta irregularis DAH-3]|eukprot:OLL23642.1 putative mannosyl-oligosaccharide alpha-1,2-mannosidase [Neolecta irregularis DAH-3]
MNLEDEIKEADSYIRTIDWKDAIGSVDPFETIIRFLGGLVSAYDISHSSIYLDKAVKLAKETLTPMMGAAMGACMQKFLINQGNGYISAARAGTNWLEFYRLSQQTNSPEFHDLASKEWEILINPPVDGPLGKALINGPVERITGLQLNGEISFGAEGDSYYEYLIKAWIMAPLTETALYRDRWVEAIETAMRNLSVTTREGHTFLAMWKGNHNLEYTFGHLGCFIGGNVVLGARALLREDFMKWGEELIAGCHHTYASTPTGLGPECIFPFTCFAKYQVFRFVPADEPLPVLAADQQEQLAKWGFWIVDGSYGLRPEVIESYFYGWRITGNVKYREWAWDAFLALSLWTKAEYGHAQLADVITGQQRQTAQESFWYAETLKYLYLCFDEPERWSLDDWVFNTGMYNSQLS